MSTIIEKAKWDTAPLGSLCSVVAGGTPSRKNREYYGGGIPWVKISDMLHDPITETEETISQAGFDNSNVKLLPAGTLLISIFATIGRTAVLGLDATTNQAIVGVTPREGVALAPRFLRRFLDHSVDALIRRARGVAQANVNASILKEIAVPLPPLREQKRIAAILDKADAIRRKRRDATTQFHDLLRSAFLDFFGDPLANPKKWPMSSFGEQVAKLEYGPRFYNEPYSPDGVRIVRITDLDFLGRLNFDAMPRMNVCDDVRKARCLKPGDIILARSGATVGKSALIEDGNPECIAGAYFIRLQLKPGILPLFAKLTLDSKPFQTIIAEKSKQSAQQNFSGPGIRALPLPVPPNALQEEFAALRERVRHGQLASARHLEETETLFNTLVQRAFHGEL